MRKDIDTQPSQISSSTTPSSSSIEVSLAQSVANAVASVLVPLLDERLSNFLEHLINVSKETLEKDTTEIKENTEPNESISMRNDKHSQITMIVTIAGTIIALFALISPIIMWCIDAKVGKLEAKIEAGQVENREQFRTLSTRLDELDKRYTIQQTYYEKVIDERTKK